MSYRKHLAAGLAIFFSVYWFFNAIYLFIHPVNGLFAKGSCLVIVPAAVVNGRVVSYCSVIKMAAWLKDNNFVKDNRSAFTVSLNKRIEQSLVKKIAKELEIDYQFEVPEGHDYLSYKYLAEPILLAERVTEQLATDQNIKSRSQEELFDLRERLVAGMPFSSAAAIFSEDVSAAQGGELGYFNLNELPTWLAGIINLSVGEISEPLVGPDAYWLIKVISKDDNQVKLVGIAFKKDTLSELLAERLESNKPWVFVW